MHVCTAGHDLPHGDAEGFNSYTAFGNGGLKSQAHFCVGKSQACALPDQVPGPGWGAAHSDGAVGGPLLCKAEAAAARGRGAAAERAAPAGAGGPTARGVQPPPAAGRGGQLRERGGLRGNVSHTFRPCGRHSAKVVSPCILHIYVAARHATQPHELSSGAQVGTVRGEDYDFQFSGRVKEGRLHFRLNMEYVGDDSQDEEEEPPEELPHQRCGPSPQRLEWLLTTAPMS